MMIKAFNNSIQRFDLALILYISELNGRRILDRFFYLASKIGDGHLYVLIGIFLIFSSMQGRIKILFAGLLAFAIELPIYFIIKRYVKRKRPFEQIENFKKLIAPPDKYSFPSGHTAAAFVMASVFSFVFPLFCTILYFLASLIGFSRLYLRVHYPTDILAGCLLGILSAKFSLWIIF